VKVNPWLAEAIKCAEQIRIDPQLTLIVRVERGRELEVASELRKMGLRVLGWIPGFVRVRATIADIDAITRIPYVINVSYDVPVWPMACGIDELLKSIAVKTDPLLEKLHSGDLQRLGIKFKPAAILPTFPEFVATKIAQLVYPLAPSVFVRDIEWKLVTDTRTIIEAPSDFQIKNTKVAVIDTGANPHPALRKVFEQINLTFEPPIDTMGHGMWCSTCAFGDPVPTRYGNFIPVASAPGDKFLHVKIFTAFGPTSTWHVMYAMMLAADWGSKIVSMSLGGPLQGSVDEDPECVQLKQLYETFGTIFVVAAGNEGPDQWTIASPGASPYAITVGALDWKTLDVSSYSSRGPQGEHYKDNRSKFEEDLGKYGDLLIKPDLLAPGGDKKTQIVSGVTGWYDSLYDLVPDGFEAMIGTSMATPHAAGLIALLFDRGIIRTAEDVKNAMRALGPKSNDEGWGTIKLSLFKG